MDGQNWPAEGRDDINSGLKTFDAFDVSLGDMMRGERATLGKSLLDVQRDLRIKADYIAAIESADASVFDTPGFVAGYVRSYARYLGLNPEDAYDKFCAESGFAGAHAAVARKEQKKQSQQTPVMAVASDDPLANPRMPYLPERSTGFASGLDAAALTSIAVLIALIMGLGYGGYALLKEVQKVAIAPVEATPEVVSIVDPIARAMTDPAETTAALPNRDPVLERLYRPQALDTPVLDARDGPIAVIDPERVGVLAPVIETAPAVPEEPVVAQVVEKVQEPLTVLAVRPAWVRVSSADGTTLFEGIMAGGDTYTPPATENPALLKVGESGALYFKLDGKAFGPAGRRGTVTSKIVLDRDAVVERYAEMDPTKDTDLESFVRVADAAPVTE